MVLSMVLIPDSSMEDHTDHEQSSCCISDTDQTDHHNEKEDDGCCEKGCNPFLNCCGMMGFVPIYPASFSLPNTPEIFTITDFYLSPASTFSGDIWQPPRV